MDVIDVPSVASHLRAIEHAARALSAGGLLIFPTDTLYALGGPAADPRFARLVRGAKGRDDGKPLPVVAADVEQARALTRNWTPGAERLAARFWPGPLTLVVAVAPHVPEGVTAGTGTIAVRVPALELTRQLCRALGPLISTSANRSGGPPPQTCAAALLDFRALFGLALDAGAGNPSPSTIVDLTVSPARLVRAGAIAWSEVQRVLDVVES